jgi:2-dehydropantoate 2-reductase
MQIGVIGAGAVGGSIAALLRRAGHDVEITARGDHLAAVREHGIVLSGAWGDFTAMVGAHATLTRTPELVILATKAQDAVAAIEQNVERLRGVPIVVVQNGLAGFASARQAAPGSDVIGALATYATSFLSAGQVTVTTAGPMYLGAESDDDAPARWAAHVLNDAIPTTVIDNFAGAQWTKLIINQVNALPAITGLSVQEVVADRALRRVMTASMREAVRVGLNAQVRFGTLQGLGHRGLSLFAAAPLWAAQLLPRLMSARIGAVPNPGSTLQSIRRGQTTEIDYLNGAVVRESERAGKNAPVNALLVALVHEVENTGRFFTSTEVAGRYRGNA